VYQWRYKLDLSENLSFIGLARKAGALAVGAEAVEWALSKGKAKLLIIASDAGRSTVGKYVSMCTLKGIPVARSAEKEVLGKALGRYQVAVAAVTEIHFAKKMLS
jgi:ribosomal protein L7Ae-like RNA K-turn-binding protein